MQTFELKDEDCAIILKEDGSTEVILPNYEDGEAEVSDNMLIAVGIVTLLPKPEFQELLSATMAEALGMIDEEE